MGSALDVGDPEADTLIREFAEIEGGGIAVKEAIARRRDAETPRETAARLRETHGISLAAAAKRPLARRAFDGMWDDRCSRSRTRPGEAVTEAVDDTLIPAPHDRDR